MLSIFSSATMQDRNSEATSMGAETEEWSCWPWFPDSSKIFSKTKVQLMLAYRKPDWRDGSSPADPLCN